MKTLYESILDDEDILINKIESEYDNIWSVIYSLLKHKELDRCVKYLNDNLKLVENGSWQKTSPIWKDSSEVIFRSKDASFSFIRVFTLYKTLYISFPKLTNNIKKKFIEDLRNNYNISENDYKKFKRNIIKELDLVKDNTFTGDHWRSLKYNG